MKWMNHTIKSSLILFSVLTGILTITPNVSVSAEGQKAVRKQAADSIDPAVDPLTPSQDSVDSAANNVSFKTLSAITVSNNSIVFSIDGTVSDYKTFRLNKPERFVIDLMNVKSTISNKLLPLNASGVASARIGVYPDKVRVVFDSINGSFPEATAVKSEKGLIINLDPRSVDENANTKLTAIKVRKPVEEKIQPDDDLKPEPVKQSSPEKQLSPTPIKARKSVGYSDIEMIDFQVLDNISRVSIKINGDINTDVPVKTPGFVSITIKNATLSKNLQHSLETRSFVSPVLRVTPVLLKSKKGSDAKIRIATRVESQFSIRQEGDMLYIDFKHPEGLAGDKLVIEAAEQKSKAPVQKSAQMTEEEVKNEISSIDSTAKSTGNKPVYKGRKVTLEFADAEVRKIFQLLSEVSNKNFVLGDDVTGAISLKLVNVPWDQALEIILDTKGLDKREDGNIILIKGKGKFKSQADEELEIKKTIAKGIELKTEMFSVNYADVSTIQAQFSSLKSDRGIISTDTRTNTVIVKDVPTALEDMRKLLKQLDVPERQVMIEARIIFAKSDFTKTLGVNWGMHYRDASASFSGINSMDSTFGGIANSVATTSGVGGTAGGISSGFSFGKLTSNIALDMRLNAAATASLIKIVSSPKVATLNHKTAKISQGNQIPYQNTTATTGAVTAFVAATLSLEVTPHINANGTIVMKIDAKDDAPGTGSPPSINTKQATTELLLKDGETTVIGGIFVDSDTDEDAGVPYLMDIPLIGKMFSSNSKIKNKSELLIFVTPRIINPI